MRPQASRSPTSTFIATIGYPLSIGAKVVIADVDARTINMDPQDAHRKITDRTKVIIPVHIGGYPVDMAPIMLARSLGITVIEDPAHAFGATCRGRMVGTIGHFGAFSFHEVKNVTARGVVNIPHFAPLYKFSIMRQLGYDTEAIQATCPVSVEAFNRRFTHLPLYEFSSQDLQTSRTPSLSP